MKRLIAMLLVLAMALAMAACGGAPAQEQPSGADAPVINDAPKPVPEDAPTGDGVLNVGTGVAIDTLTPFRSNTGQDAAYMTLLFESLAALTEGGKYEPWAAKSWTTTDGGFTYDIEIYDYIYDAAGNHITADDIVWVLESTIAAALKPDFGKIESVTKTGDYTLQVKMKSNMVGLFESILKHTFIISKSAYEASADGFATAAVTTSPYEVTEFTASAKLAFVKRADYWQKDESLIPNGFKANTEAVTFHIITEASQMGIALETGVIEVAIDMAASTATQYVGNDQFYMELTDNMQGWTLFFSGAESPVADDVKLRQAVCYALDAQAFITGVAFGYGEPMYDVCPPTAIGYQEQWKTEDYYPYNPELAKQLVAESNYNGETLTIICTAGSQRTAEIFQGLLSEVGIKVELDVCDMARLTAIRLDGTQYDFFINTIGATTLANHWSIRYDPNAYKTGDGTSRKDLVLGEMLYKTWTVDGYTPENIDAVHDYLRDNAIGYGLYNPKVFTLARNEIGLTEEVKTYSGYMSVAASTFTNY